MLGHTATGVKENTFLPFSKNKLRDVSFFSLKQKTSVSDRLMKDSDLSMSRSLSSD